jgi:geranylgeranyl reductase family protein
MYDVIVAGAGPAGSSCARACAQQGLSTLLLDRDRFPRSKPCGGAVSSRALSYLDFSLPEELIEHECFGVRVRFGDRLVEARKNYRLAALVSRDRFDAFLTDKAVESGARFLPESKIADIRETPDCVEVVANQTSYQARFLIGADGVNSRVAFALRRRPFPKSELALALVSGVPRRNEPDGRQHRSLDMHFGVAPQGYGWLFPHRGYSSVGVMGRATEFEDPKKALSDFSRSLGMEVSGVQSHFIPLGGIKRKIASKRILLAGDAAGFADAFQGEGISHAILSGKLAAEAIAGGIRGRKGPEWAAARYRRNADRILRKNLLVALRMAVLLDKHPELFLRLFFDHPPALEQYLDVIAGRTDYLHFQRWLISHLPFLLLPKLPVGLPPRHGRTSELQRL